MRLTRRNFLRFALPAAIAAPLVLEEELFEWPFRRFFLPAAPKIIEALPLAAPGSLFIPNLWAEEIARAITRAVDREIMLASAINAAYPPVVALITPLDLPPDLLKPGFVYRSPENRPILVYDKRTLQST